MDKLANPASRRLTPASFLLNRSLRGLCRSARHLQHQDPYAAARLARIADQAEYFLQQWPDEHWLAISRSNWPLPDKAVLLAWLATVKEETSTEATWTAARWQQASSTLLAALVPFE